MKLIILFVVISLVNAEKCQFEQKEQCLLAEGCVWNKRSLKCEEHNLNYRLFLSF